MIRYVLTIFMSLWVSSALAQDCTKTHVLETTKPFSTLRSAILVIRKNGP